MDINNFKKSISGDVLSRTCNGYQESINDRWNLDCDNYPLLIVNPKCDDDIIKSIEFSKRNDLILTIRGGGHSLSSNNVDGLLLDLKYYKNICIDENNKTITAQGGCLLGEVDAESQKYNLVIPTGQVSGTGLAGLCLGGGVGHLTRSYGLTSDNLIQVKLIDYNGNIIISNDIEHSDLFWGLKTAGSNFGVIIELKFRAHYLDNILLGKFIMDKENGKEALYNTCKFLREQYIPRELAVSITIDFKTVVVFGIYNGPSNEGGPIVEKLSSYIPKEQLTSNSISKIEYTSLQKSFDDYLPRNKHYYKRGFFIDTDPNEQIFDLLIEEFKNHPTDTVSIVFTHLGGALKDFNDSSFQHRNSKYLATILSIIPTPQDKPKIYKWTHDVISKLNPYITAHYSNVTDSDQLKLDDYFSDNTNKLIQLKKKYDPNNVFKGYKNLLNTNK